MLLTDSQKDLARILFKVGAVQFGAFRLKLHETTPHAPLSPIFLNLRTPDNPKPGPLTSLHIRMAVKEMWVVLQAHDVRFNFVAGVPNAGDPFAADIAHMASEGLVRRPCIALQKTTQADGGTRSVTSMKSRDTHHAPGERVLLVDDLVTEAGSKLEAIRILEDAGLRVEDVVVLVDRQQGGEEELVRRGHILHRVFTLVHLLDFYREEGLITPEKFEEVMAYLHLPVGDAAAESTVASSAATTKKRFALHGV